MKLFVETSDVLPLVDVEVAFPVGSLQDPEGREGLAHLTGNLMRRGPRGISRQRFEEELAVLGARLTVEVSMRTTRIRATVLRRNLDRVLSLLARLVWRPALRQADFGQLKRHARAVLVARLDDDQTLGALGFRGALFGEHPYARRLGGTAKSLASIRLAEVTRFYREHLESAPFVVGFAGDVSRRVAHQLVRAHFPVFETEAAAQRELPRTRVRQGRHVVIIDKPARTQTQLFIGTLGARTRDPRLFPMIVSNTAFGGTFSGPLMKEVRGTRGWSYGVYSRLLHSKRRDAWYMWTAPAVEYSADCAALQLQLLERWVDRGLGKKDHRFAQQFLINSHCFDRDTPSKRLEASLDVALLGIPKRFITDHDRLVLDVTKQSADAATRALISKNDLTIVVVASAKDVRDSFAALPGIASVEVRRFDEI